MLLAQRQKPASFLAFCSADKRDTSHCCLTSQMAARNSLANEGRLTGKLLRYRCLTRLVPAFIWSPVVCWRRCLWWLRDSPVLLASCFQLLSEVPAVSAAATLALSCPTSIRRPSAGAPGPRASRRCYDPHSLVPFCPAANSKVASEKHHKGMGFRCETHRSARRRAFSSRFKIWKRPEDGASLWHKSQNGRSPSLARVRIQSKMAAPPWLKRVRIRGWCPTVWWTWTQQAAAGEGCVGNAGFWCTSKVLVLRCSFHKVFFSPGNDHLYAGMCSRQASLQDPGKQSPWQETCVCLPRSVVKKQRASVQIGLCFVRDPPRLWPSNTVIQII